MISPSRAGHVRGDALERKARERGGAHEDWADFIARNLCSFTVHTGQEPTFEIDAWVRTADEFMVGRFTTVAGRAQLDRRRKEIRADNQDRYTVYLSVQGEHELEQFGRDARACPDSMVLTTMTEPLLQTKLGDNDTIYFFMPRHFVDQRLIDGADICIRAVDARNGVQRLARETVRALEREALSMSAEELQTATRLTGELLLLAFAGVRDLGSDVSAIRAANLARVKRIVRAKLADADLTLETVARECGLSLRYLHDLFRDDGRTASEFLRFERLQRARRMLESGAGRRITEVSMSCGFSSPSQFSTSFRRAYGISPRDVLRRV